jgi:hypothetical protein
MSVVPHQVPDPGWTKAPDIVVADNFLVSPNSQQLHVVSELVEGWDHMGKMRVGGVRNQLLVKEYRAWNSGLEVLFYRISLHVLNKPGTIYYF